jgi:hypothetical protein
MQRVMESLWADSLKGRLTCETIWYPADGCPGERMILRLDGEVIWDYPMQFYGDSANPPRYGAAIFKSYGSWYYDPPTKIVGRYIDTPRDELFLPMKQDDYLLGDILRAADRRIGYKRLIWWAAFEMTGNGNPARKVLGVRFENKPKR